MGLLTLTPLEQVILALSLAFFITSRYIPYVIKIDHKINLTDNPGKRKVHHAAIPTLGGIGIFGGFGFGFLLAINGQFSGAAYFIAATMILFFIGIRDDLINTKPAERLIAEICATLIIFMFTDLRLSNLHGFLGITDIPTWFSLILTIFVVVVIINSLNLIDGIDGLAASVGIIASLVFGTFFWLSEDYGYAILASALVGSLVAFLIFNISGGKNKIFMGDTGSIVIGFILAVMALRFNETNLNPSEPYYLKSAPAISIAILVVPLFDTLRVFVLRTINHRNPFNGDKRHIHHLMLSAGFNHRQSTLCISLASIFIVALAFLLDNIGILNLTLVILLTCIGLTEIVRLMVRKEIRKMRSLQINKPEDENVHQQTAKGEYKKVKELKQAG